MVAIYVCMQLYYSFAITSFVVVMLIFIFDSDPPPAQGNVGRLIGAPIGRAVGSTLGLVIGSIGGPQMAQAGAHVGSLANGALGGLLGEILAQPLVNAIRNQTADANAQRITVAGDEMPVNVNK